MRLQYLMGHSVKSDVMPTILTLTLDVAHHHSALVVSHPSVKIHGYTCNALYRVGSSEVSLKHWTSVWSFTYNSSTFEYLASICSQRQHGLADIVLRVTHLPTHPWIHPSSNDPFAKQSFIWLDSCEFRIGISPDQSHPVYPIRVDFCHKWHWEYFSWRRKPCRGSAQQ